MVELAGLILCGGRGTRMGGPKASLPFDDEPLLARVVRRLTPAVGLVAVVGSRTLALPTLPSDVLHLVDGVEDEGPLEALAVGLEALRDRASHAFVTACDAPFVEPAFVRRLRALAEDDGAIPNVDGRAHPLAAVYATRAAGRVRALRDRGERRARSLIEVLRLRQVSTEELLADEALAGVDPTLRSLMNVNHPSDLEAALAMAAREARSR